MKFVPARQPSMYVSQGPSIFLYMALPMHQESLAFEAAYHRQTPRGKWSKAPLERTQDCSSKAFGAGGGAGEALLHARASQSGSVRDSHEARKMNCKTGTSWSFSTVFVKRNAGSALISVLVAWDQQRAVKEWQPAKWRHAIEKLTPIVAGT